MIYAQLGLFNSWWLNYSDLCIFSPQSKNRRIVMLTIHLIYWKHIHLFRWKLTCTYSLIAIFSECLEDTDDMLWDIYKRKKSYKVLASYDEIYIAGKNMARWFFIDFKQCLVLQILYSLRKPIILLSSCFIVGLVVCDWLLGLINVLLFFLIATFDYKKFLHN